MNRTLRIIILLGIAALLIGGGVAYYMFNKPHTDVAGTTPHHTETAVSLHDKVKDIDLTKPNDYNDKIVQVSGTVGKVNKTEDGSTTVFLSVDDMGMNSVACALDASFKLANDNQLTAGSKVTLKGIFSGVNKFEDPDFGISTTDVMLSRCVVVE